MIIGNSNISTPSHHGRYNLMTLLGNISHQKRLQIKIKTRRACPIYQSTSNKNGELKMAIENNG